MTKVLLIENSLSFAEQASAIRDFGINVFHAMNRTCVDSCPSDGGQLVINYCFYSEPQAGSSNGTESASPESVTYGSSLFESVSRDLEAAWPELLGICGIALALSVLLLVILRFFAWLIVYLVVAVVVIGAFVLTGFSLVHVLRQQECS
ncbi:uncharacterized protein LOC119106127 [Pollicipes pollicipes]|uniref:uncharacterized protein LOC119106127 n=1 Tax=Pollicipes pollicipes TaxID=41117 RepID=UPI00188536CC|nr:uncharacterized protein LOC119106127 [Pollicipes pollicipes]